MTGPTPATRPARRSPARVGALLAAALLVAAGGCDRGDRASEDLASVAARGDDAAIGEPAEVPAPAPTPVTLEHDPLPTAPGVHDVVVTTVEPDGRRSERGVRLHVPAGDGPFPLVVALHPFGSTGPGFDDMTRLGQRAAAAGAVVVLPDGLDRAWNAAITCCEPAVSRERPDVGFVTALVRVLDARMALDLERVGAVGFSNGGYLAHRLACEASDVFRAIVVHAGTMDLPCRPEQPVSVLHLHGDQDRVIPMVDDRAPHSPGVASRSARDVAAFWAAEAGCDPVGDDDRTRSTTWDGCDDDLRVAFRALAGVGHRWPAEPDATGLAVEFLLDPENFRPGPS